MICGAGVGGGGVRDGLCLETGVGGCQALADVLFLQPEAGTGRPQARDLALPLIYSRLQCRSCILHHTAALTANPPQNAGSAQFALLTAC